MFYGSSRKLSSVPYTRRSPFSSLLHVISPVLSRYGCTMSARLSTMLRADGARSPPAVHMPRPASVSPVQRHATRTCLLHSHAPHARLPLHSAQGAGEGRASSPDSESEAGKSQMAHGWAGEPTSRPPMSRSMFAGRLLLVSNAFAHHSPRRHNKYPPPHACPCAASGCRTCLRIVDRRPHALSSPLVPFFTLGISLPPWQSASICNCQLVYTL